MILLAADRNALKARHNERFPGNSALIDKELNNRDDHGGIIRDKSPGNLPWTQMASCLPSEYYREEKIVDVKRLGFLLPIGCDEAFGREAG